jgi:hypothetical protein
MVDLYPSENLNADYQYQKQNYSKKHTISSCFHCFYEAIFTNISHFNK